MAHRIEFTPAAVRELQALPRPAQQRIKTAIDALAETPRPPGVKKLVAEENLYRIRVGDYRVLFQVQDRQLLVLIVKVGHRSQIYR